MNAYKALIRSSDDHTTPMEFVSSPVAPRSVLRNPRVPMNPPPPCAESASCDHELAGFAHRPSATRSGKLFGIRGRIIRPSSPRTPMPSNPRNSTVTQLECIVRDGRQLCWNIRHSLIGELSVLCLLCCCFIRFRFLQDSNLKSPDLNTRIGARPGKPQPEPSTLIPRSRSFE